MTDHLVRKLAHFCEYGALGILAGALLLVKKESGIFRWSYALLCALAVAVIDESIQLLADGRGAQVQDVLLDTAGSLTGLLTVWLIAVLVRWLRHRDRTASQDRSPRIPAKGVRGENHIMAARHLAAAGREGGRRAFVRFWLHRRRILCMIVSLNRKCRCYA